MIESKIVERIAVTDEAGISRTVLAWRVTDTSIRGGKKVTIEKEWWDRLSTGEYFNRADDETFDAIPAGGGAGVRLKGRS